MPSGVNLSPGAMWGAGERYVRPPASNRWAAQYARMSAYGANQAFQPGTSVVQSQDSLRRYQTPTPLRLVNEDRLPYLEGSDEMYPQLTVGGGASVRYQNLTRHTPPGALAMQEENRPFTTRMRDPPKWGVMKIGNVSDQ